MGVSKVLGGGLIGVVNKLIGGKKEKAAAPTPAATEPEVKAPVPTQNIYSSPTLDQEDATLGRKKLLGT